MRKKKRPSPIEYIFYHNWTKDEEEKFIKEFKEKYKDLPPEELKRYIRIIKMEHEPIPKP